MPSQLLSRPRDLASDERAGRFARYRYSHAYRRYLRDHWSFLLSAALTMLAATAVAAFIMRGTLLRGIVIGVGVTATAAGLSQWVLMASGFGPLYMGELAERWTAGELRSLSRQGWRVINHFGLATGDVDHVVIGPPGVFVVETKWSALGWSEGRAVAVARAAYEQAERRAKQIAQWQNYKQLGLPVPRPVVALWGDGAADLALSFGHPGVQAGSDLAARLRGFGMINARLTLDQVDAGWLAMSEHLRRRDAYEESTQPIPASFRELGWRLASGVLAGLGAFMAAAYLTKAGLPTWAWAAAVTAAVCLLWAVPRRTKLRPLILGSTTGLLFTLLLVAAAAGDQLVR